MHMPVVCHIHLLKCHKISYLEYAGVLWNPYRKGDIKCLEKVQMRATKLVNRVKHLSYEDQFKKAEITCGKI